jgi:hypothetical protein
MKRGIEGRQQLTPSSRPIFTQSKDSAPEGLLRWCCSRAASRIDFSCEVSSPVQSEWSIDGWRSPSHLMRHSFGENLTVEISETFSATRDQSIPSIFASRSRGVVSLSRTYVKQRPGISTCQERTPTGDEEPEGACSRPPRQTKGLPFLSRS